MTEGTAPATFVACSLGVDPGLGEQDPDHLQVSLLDGLVEGAVAALVDGGEVGAVRQQHGRDGRQVGLGRDVQTGLAGRVEGGHWKRTQ